MHSRRSMCSTGWIDSSSSRSSWSTTIIQALTADTACSKRCASTPAADWREHDELDAYLDAHCDYFRSWPRNWSSHARVMVDADNVLAALSRAAQVCSTQEYVDFLVPVIGGLLPTQREAQLDALIEECLQRLGTEPVHRTRQGVGRTRSAPPLCRSHRGDASGCPCCPGDRRAPQRQLTGWRCAESARLVLPDVGSGTRDRVARASGSALAGRRGLDHGDH